MLTIAIDGPGGAGKSTVAKSVATRLNVDYIDTGAMYRAVAYKTIINDVDVDDTEKIKELLEETVIDFSKGDIFLDGKNVNKEIREPEISKVASKVSQIFEVREKLVELQRIMAKTKSVVMDGRDIGTNVLQEANCKFYMTASPQERAKRRYDELKSKGKDVSYEDVFSDIVHRDKQDMERELNPLRKAEDAVEIDTTGLNIQEVVDIILKKVQGLDIYKN